MWPELATFAVLFVEIVVSRVLLFEADVNFSVLPSADEFFVEDQLCGNFKSTFRKSM